VISDVGSGVDSKLMILQVLDSLWSSFCSMIGIVGLRPSYLLFIVVVVVGASVVIGAIQAFRGRTAFSLEDDA